jgi:cardiolipin synthase
VKVNLLVDAIGGSEMSTEMIEQLEESGVYFCYYNPLDFFDFDKTNRRTHRKLIIVDGSIGMTGGFGFSEFWDTDGSEPDRAHDIQVLVEGPVVGQMQSIFFQNWLEVSGEMLSGDEYFPELPAKGNMKTRMIHSSPHKGSSSIQHVYLLTIYAARKYFWMENSYFVPDRLSQKALIDAARRGVDVQLILATPETSDVGATVHAGRNYYGKLLRAGVKICEYRKQKLHSKFAIVDDVWSTLGSANFDNRSFKLNLEANVNVYDRGFAQNLKNVFQTDLKDCTQLTLSAFESRSFWQKSKELLNKQIEDML